MKKSNRLVLLVGILLAAIAFVGVIVLSGGGTTAERPPADPDVTSVFAIKEIPLGVPISEDAVENRTIKASVRASGAFADKSLVIGKVARQRILPEQQVTVVETTGTVGAITQLAVPPGLVGIAVSVNQESGVGTVIRTGDYVDLLVGITDPNFPVFAFTEDEEVLENPPEINSTSVKLLVQGMQVLGTLLPPPPAPAEGENAQASPEPGDTTTGLTGQTAIVIVAATPQQAEIIKFAQMDGLISLVLRSPQDFVDANGQPASPPPVETTGIILRALVDDYGVLVPELVQTVIPEPITP